MSEYHTPVMLTEVLKFLNITPGKWYVDCNLGGGGHTEGLLQAGGKVLGLDLDPDAIREVAKKYDLTVDQVNNHLEARSENLILYQGNFADLSQITGVALTSPVSGIVFDLGVSTHQLESPQRGFSFNIDAPLDMRMNPDQKVSAKELINGLYEKELAALFWKYGEERFARPIAKKIIEVRQKMPITTTNQLAGIIASVRHRTPGDRTHPATRVFQALRIAVNDELSSLEAALPQALSVLQPGGRIVVISFHSLEDRIVKNYYTEQKKAWKLKILTDKPIIPSEKEKELNIRSHSGKLRVAEKNYF